MSGFTVKYPRVGGHGHTVSHAKNRRKRTYKYNLKTVTITDPQGKKLKMKVPARLIRTFKKHGVVPVYKKAK